MAWNDAAKRISNQLELNMYAYSISSNNDFDFIDTNNQRYKKFGITSGIVVLISPDGFVAWW
jgi:hypothetical protein